MDPADVVPPHAVRDVAKAGALAADMAARGWRGRPLLVVAYSDGDGLRALTGTHRRCAALIAGIAAVPVYAIGGHRHGDPEAPDDDADARDGDEGVEPRCWCLMVADARGAGAVRAALAASGDAAAVALFEAG